jgi:glycosyltransferase involved in cell wall biosynthesis
MQNSSALSVIVPVWNARETLAEALRSVERQTEPPFEVILVDDGSTDRIEEVVQSTGFPVQFFRQANCGPAAARNHGFRRSTGSLVAFLDADDIWPEDSLRILSSFLARQPEAEVVQGKIQDVWPDPESGERRLGCPRWAFNLGSALFRRSLLEQMGGFDPSFRTGEDVEFWMRCKEYGLRRQMIEDVTLYYRRRPNDRADGKRTHIHGLARALKQGIDRRQLR